MGKASSSTTAASVSEATQHVYLPIQSPPAGTAQHRLEPVKGTSERTHRAVNYCGKPGRRRIPAGVSYEPR